MDGVRRNTALPHAETSRTKVVRNDNQLALQTVFMVPAAPRDLDG